MSKSNTNEVVTSGTLSSTPEFTTLSSGTRQARFEIDTVERRRNRRFHNYPAYFAYGKVAEQMEEKGLAKGDSIAVEGKLRTSELDLVVEGETVVSQQTQEVEKWDATWVKVERVKTGDLAVEDMNVAKISGTLATDIDFTPTNRGTPRARFVVDSVEFRGQEEFVNSISVTVYNREVLTQLEAAGLSEGDAVELEGALQTRLSGVEVDGEKLVYKSGKNAGKQVRRKIAWITAGRVDEVDGSEPQAERSAAPERSAESAEPEAAAEPEVAAEPEGAEAEATTQDVQPQVAAEPAQPEGTEEAASPEATEEPAGSEATEEPPKASETEEAPGAGDSGESPQADPPPAEKPKAAVKATKAAAKLATSEGIDLATIGKGSREDGAIVVADVEIAIEERDKRENAGGGSDDAATQGPSEEDEFSDALRAAEELGMDPSEFDE